MTVSPAQRTLGKIAATLGMIQGLIWSVLSLTCIIMYNLSSSDIETPKSYHEFIDYSLYYSFLADVPGPGNDFVIRPRDFNIFMWFYFLLSSGWFAGSVDQFIACYFNKKRQSTMMIIWGSVTAVISLIDLVFACLLARDYVHCAEVFQPYTTAISCHLAFGIAMTLVARGYTLWVLNVAFSFMMFWNAWKIIKDDYITGQNYNYKIPRAKLPAASSPFGNKDLSQFNSARNEHIHGKDQATLPKNQAPSPERRGNNFSY